MAEVKLKKKRRVYTLDDLTQGDINLLIQSMSTKPEEFFCFGMAWYKLSSLKLIDEDTKITREGYMAVRSFQ